MLRRLAVPLLVTVLAAGCGGESSPAAPPVAEETATTTESSSPSGTAAVAPTAAGDGCLEPEDDADQVRFGPSRRLAGFFVGEGSRYVVLAHQSGADSCQMLAIGRGLTSGGYQVFAFDFSGAGASAPPSEGTARVSEDLAEAVDLVRQRGADSVAVLGASMGGFAALVAGAGSDPPLDAVVTLSAPDSFEGQSVPALDGFPSPLQVYVGRDDAGFVEASQAFAAQVPAAELFVLPGSGHGVELVDDAVFSRITEFFDRQSV